MLVYQKIDLSFGMVVYTAQHRAIFGFSPKIQTKLFQNHLDCLYFLKSRMAAWYVFINVE